MQSAGAVDTLVIALSRTALGPVAWTELVALNTAAFEWIGCLHCSFRGMRGSQATEDEEKRDELGVLHDESDQGRKSFLKVMRRE